MSVVVNTLFYLSLHAYLFEYPSIIILYVLQMSVLPSVQPFHAIAYPLDPMLALEIRYECYCSQKAQPIKTYQVLYSVHIVCPSLSLQPEICCTLLCNCISFCSSCIHPSCSYSNQAGRRI